MAAGGRVKPQQSKKSEKPPQEKRREINPLAIWLVGWLERSGIVFASGMKRRRNVKAQCHIGRKVCTIEITSQLTESHRDVLLAIGMSAKGAAMSRDSHDYYVAFTGHGVLKALGDKHARNHAHLWKLIQDIQTTLITVTCPMENGTLKVRFSPIAALGQFEPDDARFRSHHGGVTDDSAFYYIHVPAELVSLAMNDMYMEFKRSEALREIIALRAHILKSFVWKTVYQSQVRKSLTAILAKYSKRARYELRKYILSNIERLAKIGIVVTQEDGGEYVVTWDSKEHVFFHIPHAFRDELLVKPLGDEATEVIRQVGQASADASGSGKGTSNGSGSSKAGGEKPEKKEAKADCGKKKSKKKPREIIWRAGDPVPLEARADYRPGMSHSAKAEHQPSVAAKAVGVATNSAGCSGCTQNSSSMGNSEEQEDLQTAATG